MKDSMHLLLIDNYDSFTYNLYDYLCSLGATCSVVRNDETTLDTLKDCQFDALVLSPGPQRPAQAGILMSIIDYYHNKKPIFGICLGMQAIGEYFGAKLVHASLPVHGKTSAVYQETKNKTFLFDNIPNPTTVMRYHSLILKDLPDCLQPLGYTTEHELMALQHVAHPLCGVQFHPESILTQDGYQMLENWLRYIRSVINL